VRPGGVTGCSATCVRLPTQGEFYCDNQAGPWAVSMNRERVKSSSDVR
jgi:hypothetical protein